jgi:hypothetical protein
VGDEEESQRERRWQRRRRGRSSCVVDLQRCVQTVRQERSRCVCTPLRLSRFSYRFYRTFFFFFFTRFVKSTSAYLLGPFISGTGKEKEKEKEEKEKKKIKRRKKVSF